jgi:outer membrane protein W
MRKVAMLAVAVAALSLPTASRAQVSLGLRAGYGLPMGSADKGEKLSDGMKSQIPLQVDALYKVMPNLGVGLYFAYGFAQQGSTFKDACTGGVDCSLSAMRLGVQAQYAFDKLGLGAFEPWVGAGLGYEWGSLKAKYQGQKVVDASFDGFEFLNLQVGGDYRLNPSFAVGPFLMMSIGQYGNAKITSDVLPAMNQSGSIQDKTVHEWFQFGLRGKFDI